MVQVKLPDGSVRPFEKPVTVAEVAQSIGPGLANAALAGRVNGKLVDTSHRVDSDAEVAIVTDKDRDGLEVIRHSTAHLLAHAVKELFPDAQVTIGPVIEDGFYYDFSYQAPVHARGSRRHREAHGGDREARSQGRAPGDAARCGGEASSRTWASTTRRRSSPRFPRTRTISLYRQDNFVDLCRGPHVPSTGKLKVFKLMKVAGAYWRGDSKNEMLQRIYGTAWAKKEDQDAYLHRLEEAEKRDHRKLGRQPRSLPHPGRGAGHGVLAPEGLDDLAADRAVHARRASATTATSRCGRPQVLDVSLWKRSGHWDNFRENMFFTESESREYAVKPMNCPATCRSSTRA